MNLLFVHQNFPAQFRHVAAHFAADPAHRVVAIGEEGNLKRAIGLQPRIELCPYPVPKPEAKSTHYYVRGYEAAVRRGQDVVRVAAKLKAGGFRPDLVIAHPGWGEALFLRDLFPAAKLVLYAEFYYHAGGADVGFDPDFPATIDDVFRVRIKNTTQWMSLENADLLLAPTQWQKSRFPALVDGRIEVVHDGIDTQRAAPNPAATFALKDAQITLTANDEVITYVARNLEPYRGFHVFMRALPALLERRPKARVLIVGGDEVSYGVKAAGGKTWRETLLAQLGAKSDTGRVHFLGRLPYADYLRLLQVSSAHVYLTYPFVLSWSLLEAMSAGCMVIASRTAPVEEVMRHGENGWLVDFFDHQALAAMVVQALEQRQGLAPLRQAARQTVVEQFDLATRCLPRQVALLEALAKRL